MGLRKGVVTLGKRRRIRFNAAGFFQATCSLMARAESWLPGTNPIPSAREERSSEATALGGVQCGLCTENRDNWAVCRLHRFTACAGSLDISGAKTQEATHCAKPIYQLGSLSNTFHLRTDGVDPSTLYERIDAVYSSISFI